MENKKHTGSFLACNIEYAVRQNYILGQQTINTKINNFLLIIWHSVLLSFIQKRLNLKLFQSPLLSVYSKVLTYDCIRFLLFLSYQGTFWYWSNLGPRECWKKLIPLLCPNHPFKTISWVFFKKFDSNCVSTSHYVKDILFICFVKSFNKS